MVRQNVVETKKYNLYFYVEIEGQPPTIHNTLMTPEMAKECLSGKFAWGCFDHIHVVVQKTETLVPKNPIVTLVQSKDEN